jgi:hypothetical protein
MWKQIMGCRNESESRNTLKDNFKIKQGRNIYHINAFTFLLLEKAGNKAWKYNKRK